MQRRTNNNYNCIDVVKFLASAFVVGIHAHPLMDYGERADFGFIAFGSFAVPFFFVASGYFLFRKMDQKGAPPIVALGGYLKRLVIMYAFWFAVTFYITYQDDFLPFLQEGGSMQELIINSIRGSTFRGSWYLNASILCAIIIFVLSKIFRLPNSVLVLLGLIAFLPCVFYSSYRELIMGTWMYDIYPQVKEFIGIPWNRWPAGLIFMAIGKCFADYDLSGRKPSRVLVVLNVLAVPVWFMIMMWEMLNVYDLELYGANASSFSVLFLTVSLFFAAKSIWLPNGRIYGWLRAASTVTYYSHFCFVWIYNEILREMGFEVKFMTLYIGVLICSWLLTVLILNLKKIPFLRWLKYAY